MTTVDTIFLPYTEELYKLKLMIHEKSILTAPPLSLVLIDSSDGDFEMSKFSFICVVYY